MGFPRVNCKSDSVFIIFPRTTKCALCSNTCWFNFIGANISASFLGFITELFLNLNSIIELCLLYCGTTSLVTKTILPNSSLFISSLKQHLVKLGVCFRLLFDTHVFSLKLLSSTSLFHNLILR